MLTTTSLVETRPQDYLGPFVGALVDRWNRRWIILLADSIITLSTILLARGSRFFTASSTAVIESASW